MFRLIILIGLSYIKLASTIGLQPCKITSNVKNEICTYTEEVYQSNSPPEEPTFIVISVNVRDIVDINEVKQTLTLLVTFSFFWEDKRIQATNSTMGNGFEITAHIPNLWIPEVYFANSIQVRKFQGIKSSSTQNLWYIFDDKERKNFMVLIEPLTTEFSCKMDFGTFPFDQHTCLMDIRPTSSINLVMIWEILLEAIEANDQFYLANINASIPINTSGLPFDVTAKALRISTESHGQIPFSLARVQFHLKRNADQLHTLIIAFYTPSLAFTLLSQFSYFIKPEVVPGRMGMLITIFLIQTGIYGSVDAPKFRGFGYLEKWYIGMQVPILVAIMEYGFLLVIIKYKGLDSEVRVGKQKASLEATMKMIDLFSFFLNLLCCIVFQGYYLSICMKELDK